MDWPGKKRTTICYSCFEVFPLDEVKWVVHGEDGREEEAVAPYTEQRSGVLGMLDRLFGKKKSSAGARPHSGDELPEARCPLCGEPLPESIDYAETLIIGLVGGPASGKSHYIAALIEQLSYEMALHPNGCAEFVPLGDTDARYRLLYYTPLFVQREQLGLNAPLERGQINRPLVYEMAIVRNSPGTEMKSTKTYTLLFFDASGEQITRSEDNRRFNRYIFHADGLILFADPRTIEKVRSELPAHFFANTTSSPVKPTFEPVAASHRPVPVVETVSSSWDLDEPAAQGSGVDAHSPDWDGDNAVGTPNHARPAREGALNPAGSEKLPQQIFQEIAHAYQREWHRRPDTPVEIPVSLVIPKADELKYVRAASAVAQRLLAQGDPSRGYRHMETLQSQEEVCALLDAIDPTTLRVTAARFSNRTYHLVSATGSSPRSDGTYARIEPRHVLDPFGSILFRLDVIGG